MLRRWFLTALVAVIGLTSGHGLIAAADEPTLSITGGGKDVSFTRSQLLERKDGQTLEVKQDPAYPGRTMQYRAVPAAALFAASNMDANAVIQFKCLDGFSAPISKERLLAHEPGRSEAFIAIEEPSRPWPPLKGTSGPTAGPFYLVWKNPELSYIAQEEWPFQLAAFEVKGTLKSLYPAIIPEANLPADSPVQRGFAVFTKNCFACHTLNLSGSAEMGPDLNVPYNPTEYLQLDAFRRLVRDPQSLRHFPKSRMSAFPEAVLPKAELDDLVAYLQHMAKRKVVKK